LIPARIAYWLDLKGPAIAVDTACSSSLVAVHLACQSLWSGESEMALAGGVFVQSSPRFFLSANQAQMLSPSGRCAAFGAGADGIVPGEAVAAVLLRPLSDALADGDTIHGVIIGSGINQDGASNGITAPSARSQEQLIHQVHDTFAIDPDTIGMIEAHGTGTPLGDPIEYAALKRVFQSAERSGPPCFLGSIKSNIGHATTAAGISGLIRVLLSLHHRQVPPTLHFAGGNPAIPFAEDVFCVNTEPVPWEAPKGGRRRAGINAFGFSGTNAHLVVEEAPTPVATMAQPGPFMFVLSARSDESLKRQAQNLVAHLDVHADLNAQDLAFTLLMGRRHFHHRLAVVANDVAELTERLRDWLANPTCTGVHVREIDAQDARENAVQIQTGTVLLDRLSDLEQADSAGRETALQALVEQYLAGVRLPFERLFADGCRRLPLPTYPFARGRYWVDAPLAEPAVAPILFESQARSGKVTLCDLGAANGVANIPDPLTSPRIRLVPLSGLQMENTVETPTVRRLSDSPEGVCVLELLQPFCRQSGRDLRQALALAEADQGYRAIVIYGVAGWRGGEAEGIEAEITRAAWTCRLPVIAALDGSATGPGVALALMADFLVLAEDAIVSFAGGEIPDADAMEIYTRRLGRARAEDVFHSGKSLKASDLKAQYSGLQFAPVGQVYATALTMASRIAEAPREAAELLKRHMRHDLSVFKAEDCDGIQVFSVADAHRTDWSSMDTPVQIKLKTSVMTLDLFSDGVVLLQMVEKAGHNTFTPAFMDGIEEAFAAIAAEPRAKVVVLTGYDGYFACGGTADGLNLLQTGATRFTDRKIYSLPLACELPVIAAMQGHAIGAGWSLGMYADQALFAAEGVYHSNYMWYGFTPGAGATLIFPFRFGDDLGREALFTAQEYRGIDLAGRGPTLTVLPAVEVLPKALAMAHALAQQSKAHLQSIKAKAVKPIAFRLDQVLEKELAMHAKTFVGNERVRNRIAEKFAGEQAQPSAQQATESGFDIDVRGRLVATLAEDLMIDPVEIRDEAGFLDLGLDSILAVTWIRHLNNEFGTALPATVIYAHPTVGDLLKHVTGQLPGAGKAKSKTSCAPCATTSEPIVVQQPAPDTTNVRAQLIATLAEDLMIRPEEIRDDGAFLDLGLDSILAVTWIRRLNTLFGTALPATVVYAHPTVGALISHVSEMMPKVAPAVREKVVSPAVDEKPKAQVLDERSSPDAIAIIGASGAFPQANDLDAFWLNIRDGRDCIEEVPADRWDVDRFYHPDPNHPDTSYCKWMGRIDQADCFDPQFFNITPREAELMDPQQRLFLQHAWHAIEDAAYDPFSLSGGRCGVYMSSGSSGYADLIDEQNAYTLSGNSGSILAARISYFLDLHGPSLSIDTACSSSLVGIVEACDALLADRCDMALAGGVSLLIGPKMFVDTSKVGMLSKSGRCYTFDQRADGFVPGEGVGVVVLKRLDAALRDGDPIRAVIRGWGSNQDGRTNGITAPNPRAQTQLMQDVYRRFDIDPASIDLVECHGTGTPLGDPIEIEGLTDAFANAKQRTSPCVLGSVKSNVGHLLAAAGVAGAIKAMLTLEKQQLPPAVHFHHCNENINFAATPFTVNTSLQDWPLPAQGPRRVAVSAFGFSGTNAHLVLEGAAKAQDENSAPGPWLFTLSARTPDQLQAYAVRMEHFVTEHADLDLAGLAHTLQIGRSDFSQRLAFVYENRAGLLKALASVTVGQRDGTVHYSQPDASQTFGQGADEDMDLLTAKWLASGQRDKLDKLAALWVKGFAVNWSNAQPAIRLRIPGYPFAQEHFWLTPSEPLQDQVSAPRPPVMDGEKKLGLLARQSFEVPGNSVSLGGGTHGGDRLLTGLFLPELARTAVERLSGQSVRGLAHLMWGVPIRLNGKARSLDIRISSDAEGLLYQVAAEGDDVSPYHLGEVLSDAEVDKTFRPDDLSSDRLGRGGIIEHDFLIPSGSSLEVVDVRQDGAELSARIQRTRGVDGSGKGALFDADYLEIARVLAAFWQHKGQKENSDGPVMAPLAIKSLVAYGPPADIDQLRIWNRLDVGERASTVVAFYGADGTVRLVLDDIRLVQPERCDTIHLNTEYI
jgi:acyl transferase domain-containing protein/enoyl-CoA hydratase/carnithine racemase/acyl carrier protein